MNYQEVLAQARKTLGPLCKACPECNGRACRNTMPGPGAKGIGDVAIRNYDQWKAIRVNMDTLVEGGPVDPSVELFGHHFAYPFFAGPVGAVSLHYGEAYNDQSYNEIMVRACAKNGILAFTGDGVDPHVMEAATEAIMKQAGCGIPTIKPWNQETVQSKFELVMQASPVAIAMDIDAAGLPFLKNMTPPAGSKSTAELKAIIDQCPVPFIVKGIMTLKGAKKAYEAGASAIVVSNHGGRVLDQCPSTAEVLEKIAQAYKGKMTILVDGGIRSGVDVFKALALGADGVLIARPFVTALYGGEDVGVQTYIQKIADELVDTMQMCGAHRISEITREMIWTD